MDSSSSAATGSMLSTAKSLTMLRITDLRKSYREPDGSQLPILDIKEFHVDAGEQVVLMGRSGSGKTTLLHVIAGISRPDAGGVSIDGCDITRLSEAGRYRMPS